MILGNRILQLAWSPMEAVYLNHPVSSEFHIRLQDTSTLVYYVSGKLVYYVSAWAN